MGIPGSFDLIIILCKKKLERLRAAHVRACVRMQGWVGPTQLDWPDSGVNSLFPWEPGLGGLRTCLFIIHIAFLFLKVFFFFLAFAVDSFSWRGFFFLKLWKMEIKRQGNGDFTPNKLKVYVTAILNRGSRSHRDCSNFLVLHWKFLAFHLANLAYSCQQIVSATICLVLICRQIQAKNEAIKYCHLFAGTRPWEPCFNPSGCTRDQQRINS